MTNEKKEVSSGLQVNRRDFLKSIGIIGGTLAISPAIRSML